MIWSTLPRRRLNFSPQSIWPMELFMPQYVRVFCDRKRDTWQSKVNCFAVFSLKSTKPTKHRLQISCPKIGKSWASVKSIYVNPYNTSPYRFPHVTYTVVLHQPQASAVGTLRGFHVSQSFWNIKHTDLEVFCRLSEELFPNCDIPTWSESKIMHTNTILERISSREKR